MSKKDVRNYIRKMRRNQPLPIAEQKSKAIWNSLSSLEEYLKATILGFYVAIASEGEVDTIPMIEASLLQGKNVCAPKVFPDGLRFFRIKSPEEDLKQGAFGILEPVGDDEVPRKAIDLIIVPGIAFDASGNRLGFGKGYYDKFLPKLRVGTPIIALAFDFQVVDRVPSARSDMKMHKIITETRIIDCPQSLDA